MQKYLKYDFIINNLIKENITELMPVQIRMLEEFSKSKNIILTSKTGSGKTLAYLLPIINEIDFNLKKLQLLILLPTNVLAYQTYLVVKSLLQGENIDIRLYDSNTASKDEAVKLSKKQPRIVIGTIGKVFDLSIKQNALKIHELNYFVLDEADMALDNGFRDELDDILVLVTEAKKIFVSATFRKELENLIKKYALYANYINFADMLDTKIEHIWIPVRYNERIDVLNNLLRVINPYLCLIFVSKKENIQFVYNNLANKGYNCTMISSNMNIRERKRILREINGLRYQYIVTSDILARGIDIKGVSHIISYDLPYDFEFYIHRSGRTARMDSDGICYALYDKLDDNYLDLLAKRGIKPVYMDIVGDELVPYKGRNVRKNRRLEKTNYHNLASKMIPKSKKVKPGHNKKRRAEIEKLANILKNKDKKRR